MSVIDFSIRAALCAAIWTSCQLSGSAQTIVLPPWTPITVDVCGTVIADTSCGQVLLSDDGGMFSVDDWKDVVTGLPAQIGDEVRVVGENPFGLCWNGCQPGIACLFEVELTISCAAELQTTCYGDGFPNACPCGNLAVPGSDSGCVNSTGIGATLRSLGSVDIAADDLALMVDDAPSSVPGMLISGQTETAFAFRDGVLCAGSPTLRLQVLFTDANGYALSSVPLAATESLVPGDQRVYQYWFRDPQTGPCGTGSNLSNAVVANWI
jgi:hypothetical protein